MLILDRNKNIKFNIIGYEFPAIKPLTKDFDYDANWLELEIIYCDENIKKTYIDPCLLTCEFSDLVNALQQIINNGENSWESNFIEPCLSIRITKIDKFINFVFSFVYDVTDAEVSKIEVAAKWTMKEAKDKVRELKDMELKFPIR